MSAMEETISESGEDLFEVKHFEEMREVRVGTQVQDELLKKDKYILVKLS